MCEWILTQRLVEPQTQHCTTVGQTEREPQAPLSHATTVLDLCMGHFSFEVEKKLTIMTKKLIFSAGHDCFAHQSCARTARASVSGFFAKLKDGRTSSIQKKNIFCSGVGAKCTIKAPQEGCFEV
jgi:hypothetical protein